MRSHLLRWALVCLLLVTVGCEQATPPAPPVVAAPVPIAIAVVEDKSDSANETRTPPCTMTHIDQMISIVRARSGELTYGTVTKDSNRVLHRLTIELAPTEPQKPADEGNPFALREQMQAYRLAKTEYDEKLRAWKAEVEHRIDAFKAELEPLLTRRPDARRSDVFGAIGRADLFLAEAAPAPRQAFILLISDAQDNVRREFTGLQSRAQLLVVNGVGSLGSLATLQPQPERFEAIEPAIRYIEQPTTRK